MINPSNANGFATKTKWRSFFGRKAMIQELPDQQGMINFNDYGVKKVTMSGGTCNFETLSCMKTVIVQGSEERGFRPLVDFWVVAPRDCHDMEIPA